MPKVMKPFTTATRRFAAGDTVTEADDLAPHSIPSLTRGGFVEGPEPETVEKARKSNEKR